MKMICNSSILGVCPALVGSERTEVGDSFQFSGGTRCLTQAQAEKTAWSVLLRQSSSARSIFTEN